MFVRELMTKEPGACLLTDTCAEAGRIMRERDCGFVPVVETHAGRKVTGVVTDRDIALRLIELDLPASKVTVQQCMTREAKVIAPDADLEEAARIMEEARVHRLPVVEGERLVGILSLTDLASFARKRWASSGSNFVERQMAEILEAIAAAR